MSSKKASSGRRRSRPVTKPSTKTKIKRNKSAMFLAIFIVLMLVFSGAYVIFSSFSGGDQKKYDTDYPVAEFDTTMGIIAVELYNDKMPITCQNFINLVNDGFYDGMNFYRVMDDFMIQAGKYFPDDTESQSPYGTISFEVSDIKHVDGAISMARSQSLDSASAEFFICDGAQEGIDGSYAAFGVTIEGLDIVHDIAAQPNDDLHPAGGGEPFTDIVINSITIVNES